VDFKIGRETEQETHHFYPNKNGKSVTVTENL